VSVRQSYILTVIYVAVHYTGLDSDLPAPAYRDTLYCCAYPSV